MVRIPTVLTTVVPSLAVVTAAAVETPGTPPGVALDTSRSGLSISLQVATSVSSDTFR